MFYQEGGVVRFMLREMWEYYTLVGELLKENQDLKWCTVKTNNTKNPDYGGTFIIPSNNIVGPISPGNDGSPLEIIASFTLRGSQHEKSLKTTFSRGLHDWFFADWLRKHLYNSLVVDYDYHYMVLWDGSFWDIEGKVNLIPENTPYHIPRYHGDWDL